ncbi:MAG: ATP-binding cassette domain-containing protein, partial [Actinobacteria bacterium]|nr:ATP-binding cassette domain-containing protein [Actinomycetota bacterium]
MSLLEVSDLSVVFPGGRGTLPWQRLPNVRAVQGANLSIRASESVGLVGESGSGKTTLGRAILRLLHPTEGTIRLGDFDVTGFGRRTPRAYRKAVQVVFQDPVGSLNPAMTVRDIVAEPLRLNMGLQGEALDERSAELMGLVGLEAHHLDRYPYEFSGGQRQRLGFSRVEA